MRDVRWAYSDDEESGTTEYDTGHKVYWTSGASECVIRNPDGTIHRYPVEECPQEFLGEDGPSEDAETHEMSAEEEAEFMMVMYRKPPQQTKRTGTQNLKPIPHEVNGEHDHSIVHCLSIGNLEDKWHVKDKHGKVQGIFTVYHEAGSKMYGGFNWEGSSQLVNNDGTMTERLEDMVAPIMYWYDE